MSAPPAPLSAPAYCDLHGHSAYSTLDGFGTVNERVARALELGHTHLALTDHGTMAGVAHHHKACKDAGIVPIVGIEAYVAPRGRREKNREQYHLTLLALDRTGYDNLRALATTASLDGFYYKPRVDHEVLAKHSEGVVALSGCFLPGTQVWLANGALKNIEDLDGGDVLLDRYGRPGPITIPTIRPYTGDIHTIVARRYGVPIRCTANHEWLVLEGPDVSKPGTPQNRRRAFRGVPVYKRADRITDRDWLLMPVAPTPAVSSWGGIAVAGSPYSRYPALTLPPDPDTAEIIGWYLAEGNVYFTYRSVSSRAGYLSFHLGSHEPQYAGLIATFFERYGYQATVTDRSAEGRRSIEVRISSSKLAEAFLALCGNGCAEKRLPPAVEGMDERERWALLRGLFRGDGYVNARTGRFVWATVSKTLAVGVYRLLTELGVRPSLYTSRKAGRREVWYLSIGGPQARLIACILAGETVGREEFLCATSSLFYERDGVRYLPHRVVANVPTPVVDVPVRCVQMLHDPSFLAEGFAVHNCLAGELAKQLLAGEQEQAETTLDFYRSVFGERYFLEFQNHGPVIPEQTRLNKMLYQLALRHGIRVVGTNDTHYCAAADFAGQKLLTAINTGQTAGNSAVLGSPYTFMRSDQEMRRAFGDSALLRNSLEIASWVERYDLGDPVPKLPVSPLERAEATRLGTADPDALLELLAREGLFHRLDDRTDPVNHYRDRLHYELDVIRGMSAKLGVPFGRYLLMIADLCAFCRREGIRFGPRGSAAGSIVCWALGISEPDPVAEGLSFERFLNPERVELPDVDVDVADDQRDRVLGYLVEAYGREQVARVATYAAIGAKMAIRDAAKCLRHELGRPYLEVAAELVDTVPHDTRPGGVPLPELLADPASGLNKLAESSDDHAAIVAAASKIAGRLRQGGTHAAAVVVTDRPVGRLMPLQRVRDHEKAVVAASTQYPDDFLEPFGMLKMDVLGLSTLATLDEALNVVAKIEGHPVDPWAFPTDDPATWETIRAGHTLALFQLGSPGMTRAVRDLAPDSIGDLALVVAMYRPGPMANLPVVAARKRGEEPVESLHPDLDQILAPTWGIPVFQEQIMEIMRVFAGFSLGEADVVRKAMGKKKRDLMAAYKQKFLDGAAGMGHLKDEAERIWGFVVPFADYGFNFAHAVCYAYLAFQSAYLKTHWPAPFYAAAMTVEARTGGASGETPQGRIGALAMEAARRGVATLPPDVQRSRAGFAPEGPDAVRYGLGCVKGVGMGDAEKIAKGAPHAGLVELVQAGNLKRPALEALARVGALPASWGNRATLLAAAGDALELARGRRPKPGQGSLFDLATYEPGILPAPLAEAAAAERLEWEQTGLGMFITPLPPPGHAVEPVPAALLAGHDGQAVSLYGVIAAVRLAQTKKGETMAFVELSDGTARASLVCFPRVYQAHKQSLKPGALVVAHGRVEVRLAAGAAGPEQEAASLLVESLHPPAETEGRGDGETEGTAPLPLTASPPHRPTVPETGTITEVELWMDPSALAPEAAIARLSAAYAVARRHPGPIAAVLGYGATREVSRVSLAGARELLALGARATGRSG